MNNKNKSFTLIELLVVIVIIGILAGVIMISTTSSIDKANIAKGKVFSENIKNNLMLNLISEWSFDNITSYDVATGLLTAGASIPDNWGIYNATGVSQPILKTANECIFDKCLEFDGVDDYLYSSNALSQISRNYTIEAWMYAYSSPTGSRSVFSFSNCASIYLNTSNATVAYWQAYNGQASCGYNATFPNVSSNKWHHIVVEFIYDQGIKIFINNSQPTIDNTRDTTTAICLNGVPNLLENFLIGRYYDSRNFFKGKIDDVRLYNQAISSSQIKKNYIAGLDSLLSNGNISKEDYNNRINELAYE
ncbi:MAG TPA: prepilin-type N-terminal cleavage/methylation domain-containing protein [Candidatus Pacearchaeota archaeon]|nr:prepilin-type N-terminal cleavage/methylation domain-containing protein [Candidatus Pacearchaeota archaeon]